MASASWLLPVLLTLGQDARPDPPPLTEEQRAALTKMVQVAQRQNTELKTRLDEKQQELAKRYSEFKLDEQAVKKLHQEILDLQGQLLAGYHQLQVELRTIVGPERFVTLQQRLARVLGVTPSKDDNKKK